MGRSNNGVPLYLFHPYDAGYPPFVVGSKEKPEGNWICTVEFVSWADTWPRGAIQERLGSVGDPAVERAAYIRAATVGKLVEEGSVLPDLTPYKSEDWDAVFNIDPEGCEDVDDILAYKVTETGTKWLIGIADVAAFVPQGSPMDLVAAKRGQTLYEEGRVVAPMLPNIVSTGLASLRCDGAKRPVIGLVLTVGSTVVVEGLAFHQVVVGHSYTYESVPVGKQVAALSTALGRTSSDPHEWIETVMVAYNCHVAAILRKAGVGLLRRLAASEAPLYTAAAACFPDIAHLGRAAGDYCLANTTEDVSHAGLGVPVYCHASSPLRRYADLINQRCLHAILRGVPVSLGGGVTEPASLNHRALVARRMERDLWFLKQAPCGTISEATAIVLTATTVYCPAWKRILKAVVPEGGTPGSSVRIRAYLDPASPRRRVICQAAAAAPI